MIEVELPYPPSTNTLYRRVGPRTIISREGRAYRDKVRAALAASAVRPLRGPIHVVIDLYPPDRRRRDVDNTLKALLDACAKGGAYEDDSQIKHLEVRMCDPVPGGRVVVRIEALEHGARPGGARRILRGTPLCPGSP
jgi:crossover junction endodeoxyribonuclease RusA